jgi:hypothetical protein
MPDQMAGSLQDNVLTLLTFSDKYHQLVRHAVLPEHFTTFLYRDVVTRVQVYIDQFKQPPKLHLPDLCEDLLARTVDKADAVRVLLNGVHALSDGLNEEYVVAQLESFTRQQRFKMGVIEAVKDLERGDLDAAEQRMTNAMRGRLALFNPGVRLIDVYRGLGRNDQDADRVMTGIKELDHYEYGPTRKELDAFLAPFGLGKTWGMIHYAKQALLQQWRVCYVTLEADAERVIGRRMLQSLFSLTKREGTEVSLPALEQDDEGHLVRLTLERGQAWPSLGSAEDRIDLGKNLRRLRVHKNLIIRQFPTGQLTFNGLVAYLDALEASQNFLPDLLIVDYPRLMKLNDENLRLELGSLIINLRGLGVERNMAVSVAGQVNREGTTVKTGGAAYVGEDVSVMGTADRVIFYNQTKAESDLQLARLYTEKGRNEQSKFTVLISQAYQIGQFCLSSRMLPKGYWPALAKASGPEHEHVG